MKYRKIILTPQTIGLVKQRLNQITEKNIFTAEAAWGNINPNKHSIDFTHCASYIQKEVPVEIRRTRKGEKFLHVDSLHRSRGGKSINMGDTVYLGHNQILVKAGELDIILKKIYITRFTLLSRGPEFSDTALKAYQKSEVSQNVHDAYHDSYFKKQEEEMMEELFGEPASEDDFMF